MLLRLGGLFCMKSRHRFEIYLSQILIKASAILFTRFGHIHYTFVCKWKTDVKGPLFFNISLQWDKQWHILQPAKEFGVANLQKKATKQALDTWRSKIHLNLKNFNTLFLGSRILQLSGVCVKNWRRICYDCIRDQKLQEPLSWTSMNGTSKCQSYAIIIVEVFIAKLHYAPNHPWAARFNERKYS